MSQPKAYILCQFARTSGVYTPWLDRLPMPVEVVEDYAADWAVPSDAGILITHMHYRWEEISALRRVCEANTVPVLILADGILEYRNTWEHPALGDGSIFQPVCGHKLACLGKAQARIVETWGNPGRCEVVGLPRLDESITRSVSPVRREGNFRLLVATANTPSFTPEQRTTVVDSLLCLTERLQRNEYVGKRKIEVIWRLTDGLDKELGLAGDAQSPRPPLTDVIENVDAVITSPSTLYLESVVRKRPTAVLDFWNSPQYVPPAWSIAAPANLNRVLAELADPPAHKMLFQETTLADQLACHSPATPRLLRLIQVMVTAGQAANAEGRSLQLPARMLPDPARGISPVPENFDLATLYPKNEAFKITEQRRLQVELAQAIRRLEDLPYELAEKAEQINVLQMAFDAALDRESGLLDRVRELHQRMGELRQMLGVDKKVDSA